jgi:hypothetical protein
VSSTISNGEWVLMVGRTSRSGRSGSRRTIRSDQNPQVRRPAITGRARRRRASASDQNGNTVPLQNVVTSSGNCKLGVNFNSGGTLYKLLMSPFPLAQPGDAPATCPSTGCPAPGLVTVTCNQVSNIQCVGWTIVPNAGVPNANVANLYEYASVNRTATWIFIGQYYNTFRIDVTNP